MIAELLKLKERSGQLQAEIEAAEQIEDIHKRLSRFKELELKAKILEFDYKVIGAAMALAKTKRGISND